MANPDYFQSRFGCVHSLNYVIHGDIGGSARQHLRSLCLDSLEDNLDHSRCFASTRRPVDHPDVLRHEALTNRVFLGSVESLIIEV